MILKKVTRLIGFIIGAPFVLFLVYEISHIFPFNLTEYVFNLFEFLETICVIIFILGYFISFVKQILGGLMTFLSPVTFIALESIDSGAIRVVSFTIIMVVSGTFLLFTAEKEH